MGATRLTQSNNPMALSNNKTNLTQEESDMLEQVASALDRAVYILLNDLLHELKKEIDVKDILKEVELKYESLGLTVKFLGDRAGQELTVAEPEKQKPDKQLDYYV